MSNGMSLRLQQYGDCVADMRLLSPYFSDLMPEVRDILFANYVEGKHVGILSQPDELDSEISAEVVGAKNLLRFYSDCFQGQGYQLTDPESSLHEELWTYVDHEEEGGEDNED